MPTTPQGCVYLAPKIPTADAVLIHCAVAHLVARYPAARLTRSGIVAAALTEALARPSKWGHCVPPSGRKDRATYGIARDPLPLLLPADLVSRVRRTAADRDRPVAATIGTASVHVLALVARDLEAITRCAPGSPEHRKADRRVARFVARIAPDRR